MKVDWQRQANSASIGESASVLLGSRRGSGLESGLESTAARGPTETERLDRLGEALATSKPTVPEGEQAAIKAEVLAGARTGLAKMNQGEPPQNFTLGEHIGLEAVILTNGERPSLFVRNGFIDLGAPDIGEWSLGLNRFQNAIRKVIASVGRVDVPVRPWYAGTCFVVAEGLVITNRHVLEAIATQDGAGGWTLNWPDATTVDFVAEDGATAATKFRVTGVPLPDPIRSTKPSISHISTWRSCASIPPAMPAIHFRRRSPSRPIPRSRKRAATSTCWAFRVNRGSGHSTARRRPGTRPCR
jgi:hypothetical protein